MKPKWLLLLLTAVFAVAFSLPVAVATDGDEAVASLVEHVLWIPPVEDELLVPIVAVVHLQVLARYVARSRGCDVDKPRNLAKSVTVE